ncbi:MAG: peptidoglycan editing factor PgeF [Bacteroidaceae bacterium]|nr:peptidoglycan editing factor PgeF [Bacteroidaceae bacterium]
MLHLYPELTSAFAFSTERHGGVSKGAYASFNANHYCGDNTQDVEKNRQLLCSALDIPRTNLIIPHQTHDTRTLVINDKFMNLPIDVKMTILEGVDAVCTNLPKVCVCVSTADCIPVLISDPVHGVVSAVHAGWRGTVKRIVKENLDALTSRYGTNPADCQAIIGPGISLDAFEVGDEVYEEFRNAGFNMELISKRFPTTSTSEATKEKWHIDLPLCNKLQLMECGVKEENIHLSGICTYNQSDDFFSARKLGIKSGRILNGIMRK